MVIIYSILLKQQFINTEDLNKNIINIINIIIMKGGARPGGVDPKVYDGKVRKDGKDFEPNKLSPEARSYLDSLASDSSVNLRLE